jgi:cytochrome c biogenesis DsbD-like protein
MMEKVGRMLFRRIQFALLLTPGLCVAGAEQSPNPIVQWAASVVSRAAVAHGSAATVELSADIQPGWHVYALAQAPGGPTPLRVTLDDNKVAQLVGVPSGTIAEKKHDPSFDLDTQFYSHSLTLRLPVRVKQAAVGRQLIPLSVRFQTCSDRECQPPTTVHLAVPIDVLP